MRTPLRMMALLLALLWSPALAAAQALPLDGTGGWTLTGGTQLKPGRLTLKGRGLALFAGEPRLENFKLEATLKFKDYPVGGVNNPAFQLLLREPIETDKIRLVVRDARFHLTEVRFYEPGMPEYPPILNAESSPIAVPNLALHARVTSAGNPQDEETRKIVDGIVNYESRWYCGEGSRPPHVLTFELGGRRTLGCIQMVGGYVNANEWRSVPRNFEFQSWTGTGWQTIPGLRRESTPGSVGLVVRHAGGRGLALLHRNDKPGWLRGTVDAEGNFAQQAVLGNLRTLAEEETYSFKTVVLGDKAWLYLDGKEVARLTGVEGGAGACGLLSASPGTQVEVVGVKLTPLEPATCTLLTQVTIADGRKPLTLEFDPERNEYSVQIPSATTKRVTLTATPMLAGQKVTIDGQAGESAAFDVDAKRGQTVQVRIQAPGGRSAGCYTFTLEPVPPGPPFKLAYAEEFEGNALNLKDWYHRTGMRWKSISDPAAISIGGGLLHIKLSIEGGQQKAGGIISKGLFGYGYYETRAKLWKGTGWHASFWLMGTSNPGGGSNTINEIDCFESTSPDSFSTNLHYYRPRRVIGGQAHPARVAEGFHTYGWEWTPTRVRFYFDGELIRDMPYLPPHGLQNVWLTCVVHPNASTDDLPGEVLYDYFRFYKKTYGHEIPAGAIVAGRDGAGYRESGTWTTSDMAVSHLYKRVTRQSATPGSTATWTPELPAAGEYEVFAWNPYGWPDGTVTEYAYEVRHAGGVARVGIDPMRTGQLWVSLGRYRFKAGRQGSVTLRVTAPLPTRADAVMFVPAR